MNKSMVNAIFIFICSILLNCKVVQAADDGVWGGSVYHKESNRVFIGGGVARSLSIPSIDFTKTVFVIDINNVLPIKKLVFDRVVSSVSVSNSGNIAVVLSGNNLDSSESFDSSGSDLIVFNTEYKQIVSVTGVADENGVAYYEWSGSGDKLAYITAKSTPRSNLNIFKETGSWILNISDGISYKIADFGTAIHWSSNDENIFIRKKFSDDEFSAIYLYNISTKQLVGTKHRGTIFSNDKIFYIGILKTFEESGLQRIYFSETDETIIGEDLYVIGINSCFIGNTHNFLTYDQSGYDVYAVDNLAKKSSGHLRGNKVRLVGYNNDRSKLIVSDGRGNFHIEDTLTGEVIKSFTLSAAN